MPLVESAATDEYRQLLGEIDQLETEVKDLQKQKAQSWNSEYSKKFAEETKALNQLRMELVDLKKSYEHWYRVADHWGNVDWDFDIDEEKKQEVAEQEAELEARFRELETKYNEIVAGVKAEHEADFAAHTQTISDKTSVLKNKKARKEAAFKAIVEEERPELEKILEELVTSKEVLVNWDQVKIHNGLIFVPITKTFDYEVDPDDIDIEQDDTSFNETRIEEYTDEQGIEGLYTIADYLGLDQSELETAISAEKEVLLSIPNSSWKLSTSFDTEFDEPNITVYGWSGDGWNEPREFNYDYDEYVKCEVTYYLNKEI
jgi:hypothetical protein